jgi:signal transduction histidine kinase
MGIPESRLFCKLDGLTVAAREQHRFAVITELGLMDTENVPIFEEATQTIAHHLDAPICLLSLIDSDRQWFKSAVGLSRLGIMNDLARQRQIPREESFCTNVVESRQVLAIEDTMTHFAFAHNFLVQQYGIRSYLGVPLFTTAGDCIGTISMMDLMPRTFTEQEVEFMLLTARLCMSEYERQRLLKKAPIAELVPPVAEPLTNPIKFELLAQLTQELRTPLTSVMGMASVLNREIYGPLTSKQKEYLDIIHHSGQYLLSLVKEILELSQLDDSSKVLNLASVDIEMLCQQAISTLEQAAHRREQQIRLSVEPGNRIWLLDKEKIRQLLYHLMFSVIQASNAGSIVRLHVSHKMNGLRLSIWASHPCLGDGLAYTEMYASSASFANSDYDDYAMSPSNGNGRYNGNGSTASLMSLNSLMSQTSSNFPEAGVDLNSSEAEALRKNLGLLLSRQLAEMHGGQILIQGGSEPGYRYLITLPRLNQVDAR